MGICIRESVFVFNAVVGKEAAFIPVHCFWVADSAFAHHPICKQGADLVHFLRGQTEFLIADNVVCYNIKPYQTHIIKGCYAIVVHHFVECSFPSLFTHGITFRHAVAFKLTDQVLHKIVKALAASGILPLCKGLYDQALISNILIGLV